MDLVCAQGICYLNTCKAVAASRNKALLAKHFRKWVWQHAAYFFLLRLYSDGVMPVRERKALMNEDML